MALPDLFTPAGQQYGIDPLLLRAVAQVESSGNPRATSEAGAQGLMQIMPQTAAELGVADPYDPAQAIPGGAKYLAQGYKATGSPAGAIAYYHGGPDQSMWGPKTMAYVGKVSTAYQALKAANSPATAGASAAGAPAAEDATPPSSDIFKAWGVGAPAPDAAVSAAPQPSSSDIFKSWGVGGEAPAAEVATPALDATMAKLRAAPTAPVAAAPEQTADPTLYIDGYSPGSNPLVGSGLGAGIVRGARDVIDPAAEFLASHLSNSGPDVKAADAQELADYTKAQQGNAIAGIGRAGGQIATTLPLIMSAGGLLGAAGEGIAAGADAVSPALGTVARGIGNFVSGDGGGNMLMRALSRATAGAGQGAAIGGLTSGQSDAPLGEQMKQGAETGAVLGGAVLPAVSALGRGAFNALTNSGLGSEVANLANSATSKFGIPLTADQVSGSPFVKKLGQMSRQLPGSGLNDGAPQAAFTRAVGNTFGLDSDTITQPAIVARRAAIGNTLENIENAHDVTLDNPLQTELAHIESVAHTTLVPEEAKVVSGLINGILSNVKPGDTITGETFGNLIHKGSPLDAALGKPNSNISSAAGDIKTALQGALARSLPDDVQKEYQAARYQYKNLMTVAPLVVKGAPGEISPALLQNRVNVQNGSFGQSGDLGELAQIGQRFLKEPKDSGTPLGNTVARLLLSPGALLNAAASGALGGEAYFGANPLAMAGTVAAPLVSMAGNKLVGSILKNPVLVRQMIRSGLANGSGGAANPFANALINPQMLPTSIVGANRLLSGPDTQPAR